MWPLSAEELPNIQATRDCARTDDEVTPSSVRSRVIEELTLNAWPPLEVLLFDGWVLSFSNGYTRRANSIHPLYPSCLPLAEKIATCEAIYAARGRQATFKVTSSPEHAELDAVLHRLGYATAGATSVQTAELASGALVADDSVAFATAVNDRWLGDFNRLTGVPAELQPSERKLLEKIGPPHCFASLVVEDRTVAVGLAVCERGYVGLFDIVVEDAARNRGIGRRVCASLLGWGQRQGGTTAYLAVLADNGPALRLYGRLGFEEIYTYWYRHKPGAE